MLVDLDFELGRLLGAGELITTAPTAAAGVGERPYRATTAEQQQHHHHHHHHQQQQQLEMMEVQLVDALQKDVFGEIGCAAAAGMVSSADLGQSPMGLDELFGFEVPDILAGGGGGGSRSQSPQREEVPDLGDFDFALATVAGESAAATTAATTAPATPAAVAMAGVGDYLGHLEAETVNVDLGVGIGVGVDDDDVDDDDDDDDRMNASSFSSSSSSDSERGDSPDPEPMETDGMAQSPAPGYSPSFSASRSGGAGTGARTAGKKTKMKAKPRGGRGRELARNPTKADILRSVQSVEILQSDKHEWKVFFGQAKGLLSAAEIKEIKKKRRRALGVIYARDSRNKQKQERSSNDGQFQVLAEQNERLVLDVAQLNADNQALRTELAQLRSQHGR